MLKALMGVHVEGVNYAAHDSWSLGCVLVEMLTGTCLFGDDTDSGSQQHSGFAQPPGSRAHPGEGSAEALLDDTCCATRLRHEAWVMLFPDVLGGNVTLPFRADQTTSNMMSDNMGSSLGHHVSGLTVHARIMVLSVACPSLQHLLLDRL